MQSPRLIFSISDTPHMSRCPLSGPVVKHTCAKCLYTKMSFNNGRQCMRATTKVNAHWVLHNLTSLEMPRSELFRWLA